MQPSLGGYMSAAEAQSEPTMEEILASIRKIISEDDVKPQEDVISSDVGGFDDVLELSSAPEPVAANEPEPQHVEADFDFDSLGVEPEPAFEEPEIHQFDEEDEVIAVDYEPEPEPVFARPEPVSFDEPQTYQEPRDYTPRTTNIPPHLAESIGLIGAGAANAVSDSFAKLGPALPGHFASGASVEELVAYLLKPMLKEWLDNNLPRIVEERVEAELARIARRGF